MLDNMKMALRIRHGSLDDDINGNISACSLDLKRAGIKAFEENNADALITKAMELYCKWQYDFGGKGEQYHRAYEQLRNALSLSGDYMGSGEDEE